VLSAYCSVTPASQQCRWDRLVEASLLLWEHALGYAQKARIN
jgi:hypothetical protein